MTTQEVAAPEPAESAQAIKAKRKAVLSSVIPMLPVLLNAAQWNQQDQLKETVLNLAEVLREQYPSIAKKLTARLPMTPVRLKAIPDSLISASEPRHGLAQVVLSEEVNREFKAIIHEHELAAELAKYKLSPRHKILLHGAPGNGKTMAAEALAHELAVPFFQLKYGGLIDSHLGGTGKNLNQVLEFASQSPCVLFADEFDGLGASRDKQGDVGEARRITNQLLIELERVPSHCVFVAATNMSGLLDSALLRRFDFVIEIKSPTTEMVLACLRKELAPEITPGHNAEPHFEVIAGKSWPSMFQVVELCKRIRRDMVLNGGSNVEKLIAE